MSAAARKLTAHNYQQRIHRSYLASTIRNRPSASKPFAARCCAQPMTTPEEVWASLTDVERTALQVLTLRIKEGAVAKDPVTHELLYTDEPGKLAMSRCVPKEQQEKIQEWQHVWGADSWWIAIRTAELDRHIKAALENGSIKQTVIIGAGMDTRAWRLQWPEDMPLFEVDTPTMLSFKARALHGCEPTCRRAELGLDLRESSRLGPMLRDAGYDQTAQTLWLMEGFIGYLSKEDGAALLSLLQSLCAPGSVLLMTAPPTEEHREATSAKGVKLHHTTFEPSADTLARAHSCGWEGRVISVKELEERYGLQNEGHVQEVLVLHRASS